VSSPGSAQSSVKSEIVNKDRRQGLEIEKMRAWLVKAKEEAEGRA
jgi:hypothetical protein